MKDTSPEALARRVFHEVTGLQSMPPHVLEFAVALIRREREAIRRSGSRRIQRQRWLDAFVAEVVGDCGCLGEDYIDAVCGGCLRAAILEGVDRGLRNAIRARNRRPKA